VLAAAFAHGPGPAAAQSPDREGGTDRAPTALLDVIRDADGDRVPDRMGDTVVVQGVVTVPPATFGDFGAVTYLQDRSGAIAIYSPDAATLLAFQPGDSMRVRGVVGQYRGSEFIALDEMDLLGTAEAPVPLDLTVAEARQERQRGPQLVRLTGDLRARANAGVSTQAELQDETGAIPVLIPASWLTDPHLVEQLAAGRSVEVVGVVGQSSGSDPPTDGYYLYPRTLEDIRFAPVPPYRFLGMAALALLIVGLLAWRRAAAKRARHLQGLTEELEQSRNQLREREGRLRSLLENAADTVAIIDADGVILYQNPSVERILGWTAAELTGSDYGELVHPEDRDAAAEFLAAMVAESEETGEIELRCRTREGGWRTLEIIATNRIDDPAVGGVVCNARDVTEHRGLQERVRHSDRMEVVGRLAGGIAHDFNNVLTALRGHAELALSDLPEDIPGREDLAEVVRSADRAASLTRQLLAFSRQQVLKPVVVSPGVIVSGMLPMIRRLIGEQIELRVDLRNATAPVRVDPAQFEQVLMNLVVNARDAMPQGGTLSLELADHQVHTTAEDSYGDAMAAGDYVRLTVHDTGHGMGSDVIGHIFEPFFTTKEQGKGTGLGLATLYGIVRQSDGHIRADSTVGEGSRFDIFFPAVDEPLHESTIVPAEPAAPARIEPAGRVILLVEDESAVRRLARRVLEKNDYSVLEAATPTAALEIARARRGTIDLLLTDVVMPEMSGPELSEALHQSDIHIPTLFTSGYTDDEVIRHGLEGRGDTFLEKPFTTQQLLVAVRAALPAD
jgi:PAS domain S-box-containing protein